MNATLFKKKQKQNKKNRICFANDTPIVTEKQEKKYLPQKCQFNLVLLFLKFNIMAVKSTAHTATHTRTGYNSIQLLTNLLD